MARSERSVDKEAFWRAQLDQQRQSGLNVRAFCRTQSISEPSFYAWRRALAARNVERTVASRARTVAGDRRHRERLIPVEVICPSDEPATPGSDAGQQLEIITPGGFTLRFAVTASSETIARVLDLVAHHASRCTAEGISAC
jgi:hypothetical protein